MAALQASRTKIDQVTAQVATMAADPNIRRQYMTRIHIAIQQISASMTQVRNKINVLIGKCLRHLKIP